MTGPCPELENRVHKHLGPGLLEIAYQTCLAAEFENLKLGYLKEVPVPLTYCGFRADFLVENTVVVELKSVEILLPVHGSQVLSYLRFLNKSIGLLLNFHESILKKGIRRFVLGTQDEVSFLTQGRVPS